MMRDSIERAAGDRLPWHKLKTRGAMSRADMEWLRREAQGKVEDLDCTFGEELEKAIVARDYEAVAYLLWAGVTPRLTTSGSANAMCKALLHTRFADNPNFEMIRLLADHHASLMPASGDVWTDPHHPLDSPSSVAQTAERMYVWITQRIGYLDPARAPLGHGHPLLQWLASGPYGSAPVACKFHKQLIKANAQWHHMYNRRSTVTELADLRCDPNFDDRHVEVLTSWPPRGKPQWPPPESLARGTLSASTHFNVLEYWARVRRLRRVEAALASAGHWKKLRRFVRLMRPIALYWQGRTQTRLCAPGGAGRKRDFDAFQAAGF